MELQYEVWEIRLLQEVLPCEYVDSALPKWFSFLWKVSVIQKDAAHLVSFLVLEQEFRRRDTNNSGSISAKELMECLKMVDSMPLDEDDYTFLVKHLNSNGKAHSQKLFS